MDSADGSCEQMHEGTVLEMKGICIMGAMKKDRKKTVLKNEKETKRAIKAAVDQAKKAEDVMEKYRESDRWKEAVNVSNDPNNHDYE